MQEHVWNRVHNDRPAPLQIPEPQFYILSEQRTNIKHNRGPSLEVSVSQHDMVSKKEISSSKDC